MLQKNNQDNSQDSQLVFALTMHPVLGYLVEAFAVSTNKMGQFEYGFKKVNKPTYQDYFSDPTPVQISLIELLEKYSDCNLQKRFNNKKLRTREFYELLEADFVSDHIRPFIDKVIYEAVSFMIENGVELYFKGESLERIVEKQIILEQDFAETCFNFEKLDTSTHYTLQIKYRNEDIVLFNEEAVLITNKPCLLMLNNRVFRFEPSWEGKKLVPFFKKEFLEVPQSSEKQFYKVFVEKSIRQYPFKAKGFEVKIFDQKPVALLQLENHWQGNLALGLYFKYHNGTTFLPSDPANAQTRYIETENGFGFEKIVRDRSFEKQIIDFLTSRSLLKLDGTFFTLEQVKNLQPSSQINQTHLFIDWMNLYHDEITSMGIKLGKVYSGSNYFTGSMQVKLDVQSRTDWFDLYGKVQFGNIEVPFLNLKPNILAGNREYVLPDGSIAIIPEEWLSMYLDILTMAEKKGDRLELKKHHYTLLESIPTQVLTIPTFEPEITEKFIVPSTLKAQLRPYQQTGFEWMMFLKASRMGGCLADDMGLGKTIQTLALLTQVHKHEKDPEAEVKVLNQPVLSGQQLDVFADLDNKSEKVISKSSLLIMPLSLIHNWFQEIRRFSPDLRVIAHTGGNRKNDPCVFEGYDLIMTTYGTVRNDIEFLSQVPFRYIILDESQIIKNASSKIFSAIRKLKSDFRLVLTGTPVENSLTDLWSQFSFINPGLLGSMKYFKEEYVLPIEKKQDQAKATKLQKLIHPFILRRTKDQVAKELPPLTEKIHLCEMTLEQEQYYERKKSEIRNTILQNIETSGMDKSRFVLLSGLTRLRLIANHPIITDRDYQHESGKYNEIVRNIEKLLSENHKVLIFSQFVKHLNLFADHFKQQDLAYSMLTGNVSEKDRQSVIKEFQQDKQRQLFLISLKAGGVGLNLTEADYVFMLDPWWNPAVENQAINRAHRIGQDKNVFVYRFITRNTVEEKIINLQQRKSDLAQMFINQNNPLKSLGMEELNEMLL
jgi:superfamily II DNA or RNA helicase